jgi:hypothetical protein
MRNNSLVFCGFAHDSQGVLATVRQFAFVGIERGFNFFLGGSLELRITAFEYAEKWQGLSYDPQLALRRDPSLAHCEHGV